MTKERQGNLKLKYLRDGWLDGLCFYLHLTLKPRLLNGYTKAIRDYGGKTSLSPTENTNFVIVEDGLLEQPDEMLK